MEILFTFQREISTSNKAGSTQDLTPPPVRLYALRPSDALKHSGEIYVWIADVKTKCLIDSGSSLNVVTEDTYRRILEQGNGKIENLEFADDPIVTAFSHDDQPLTKLGKFTSEVVINYSKPRAAVTFDVIKNASVNILGKNAGEQLEVLQVGLLVNTHPEKEEIMQLGTEKRTPTASETDEFCDTWKCELKAAGEINGKFPLFNIPPVKIQVREGVTPTRIHYTCIPLALQRDVEAQLNKLVEQDIVEEVGDDMNKEWLSSLLTVPKADGSIRIVVDLRGPNKAVLREPYVMPTVESQLIGLGCDSVFSVIDLSSAFHHIELDEKSRELTNFMVGDRMYRYKRLPFGLANAPDIFQSTVQREIVKGCNKVKNYQDDFLVSGVDQKEHDENLATLKEKLLLHHANINFEKSQISKSSVTFLGYEVSKSGYKPKKDKIDDIKMLPSPKSKDEVRSLLGKVTFLDKFIFRRATKTCFMRATLTSEPFEWSAEAETERLKLLDDITNALELGFYDVDDETMLIVDASPFGLGAVLLQQKGNEFRFIACASRSLTATEQRYPQVQGESLAIVWGVERFAHYLLGKAFTVYTDSGANTFIFGDNCKLAKRSASRADGWSLRLQSFRFETKTIKGNKNIADMWSRLVRNNKETIIDKVNNIGSSNETEEINIAKLWSAAGESMPTQVDTEDMMINQIDAYPDLDDPITLGMVTTETLGDPQLQEVTEAVISEKWPNKEALLEFKAVAGSLAIWKQVVTLNQKVVLPTSLRRKAMEVAHRAHASATTMKRTLREYVWWPHMNKEIDSFHEECRPCLLLSSLPRREPLRMRDMPNAPWREVQIDYFECDGNDILEITDRYSRYLWVIEMKNKDSTATSKALSKICDMWGKPDAWNSDNGCQFTAAEFKSYWTKKGVRTRTTVPYSPEMNGQIERHNEGILKAFRIAKLLNEDWRTHLARYVKDYNTNRPHAVLGVTPFEALVGWKFRETLPIITELCEGTSEATLIERDTKAKEKSKVYADNRRRAVTSDVKEGDWVVALKLVRSSKSDPIYTNERFLITERVGPKLTLRSESGKTYVRSTAQVKRDPTVMQEAICDFEVLNGEKYDDMIERLTQEQGQKVPSNSSAHTEEKNVTVSVAQRKSDRTIKKPSALKDFKCYAIIY